MNRNYRYFPIILFLLKGDARSMQKHTNLVHTNRPSDSNNLLNQLRDQILDAHAKNSQKEIDYDVVKQFGKSKDKEAKQKLMKNFHHVDAESDELQEIDYDTVRKFNPSQNEEVRSESDDQSSEIEEDPENEAKGLKSPHTKVQSKGKKTMEMNTHLLESHLQKEAGSTSDGSNSPVKIISHMEVEIQINYFFLLLNVLSRNMKSKRLTHFT